MPPSFPVLDEELSHVSNIHRLFDPLLLVAR
jgi:hypothetical protein